MMPRMVVQRTLDGIVLTVTTTLLLSIAGLPMDWLVDCLLGGPLR